MIEIKNLNISSDKKSPNNISLSIPSGKITGIVGDKSSRVLILHALSLLSKDKNYEYSFMGNNISLNDRRMTNLLKRQDIGFVFNKNNLIENLNIEENIRILTEISGLKITDKELNALITLAEFDFSPKTSVKALSRDEKQVLATICSFAKMPKLLIADNITEGISDTAKGRIFELLNMFIKKYDMAVLFSTDDVDLQNYFHKVYQIDKTGASIIASYNEDEPKKEIAKTSLNDFEIDSKFFSKYKRKIGRKGTFLKSVTAVLFGLAIAIAIFIFSYTKENIKILDFAMDENASRELFVVNNSLPNIKNKEKSKSFMESYQSFSSEQIEELKNNDKIQNIYPFVMFHSYGFLGRGKEETYNLNDFTKPGSEFSNIGKIEVYNNGSLIKEHNFNYLPNDETTLEECYTAVPFIDEQNLNLKSEEFDESINDGIYISKELAERLNIKELKNIEINADFYVPALQISKKATMSYDSLTSNGQSQSIGDLSYTAKETVNVKMAKRFKVKGILQSFAQPSYISAIDGTNYRIYLPFKHAEEMLLECDDGNYPAIELIDRKTNETAVIDSEKWEPSAFNIIVADTNNISNIIKDIELIDNNFKISSPYKDLEEVKTKINDKDQEKLTQFSFVLISLYIILLLVVLSNLHRRKHTIALLRANGLTTAQVERTIGVANNLVELLIAFTAFAGTFGLSRYILHKTGIDNYPFNLTLISVVLLLVSISIIILFIIEAIAIRFYKPNKLLFQS